jgi:hypothetical protein
MFYANAEDSAGVPQGTGPLDATSAKVTRRLSKIGAVEVRSPATNPQLVNFRPTSSYKPAVRLFATRADGLVHDIGSGPIQKFVTAAGQNKEVTFSGPDQLQELVRRDVGALNLSDGAGGPMAAASLVPAILALAPPGWTVTGTPSRTDYYKHGGETVFEALNKLAQRLGDSYRLSSTVARQIEWLPNTTAPVSSGIRIIAEAADTFKLSTANDICVVKDNLTYTLDYTNTYTRIRPTGGGNASQRLSMAGTTRVAPAGYVLDTVNNTLAYTPAEVTAYDIVVANVSFKDITTNGTGAVHAASAANALYDAAKAALDQHIVATESYTLSVVKLAGSVQVGQTMYLDYQGYANGNFWISVQKDLLVTEIVESVDATNVNVVGLTLSNVPTGAQTGDNVVVSTIQQMKATDGHSQSVELYRVHARYSTLSGQSIPNITTTIVDFNTLVDDTGGASPLVTTGAAWHFTAPVAGRYCIMSIIDFSTTTTWGPTERATLNYFVNGVIYSQPSRVSNLDSSVTTAIVRLSGVDTMVLNAGDTVDIRVSQNTGAALALSTSDLANHMSIYLIQ